MFDKTIKITLFVAGFLLLSSLILVQTAEAGCCECKPPGFFGNYYLHDCRSDAFSVTDCESKCLNSNQNGYEEGYPKFSHNCDANQCPKLSEPSCCVTIQKTGGTIESCEDISSIAECQGDENSFGYFQDKECSQVEACSHIGQFYAIQGVNDTLGNVPEVEEEKRQPIYFTPQVTIPGSIKIGSGSFTINKGQGISIDGALLSKYIALVFKWFIWAIGIVAVAYMAFGGMQWLAAAGNPQGINQAKTTIRDSFIGLLLAVSSYVILFNINPALVSFRPLEIEPVMALQLLDPSIYQRITGSLPVKAFGEEMVTAMNQVAQNNNIHYCVLATIFTKESAGAVNAIGFDENVKNANVRSRRSFVDAYQCLMKSGSTARGACSYTGSAQNDDLAKDVNVGQAGLGLDWRFSRGFGVGQITIFPEDPPCNGAPHCRQIGSNLYDPRSLLELGGNLDAVANLWTSICSGSVSKDCFCRYNSGKTCANSGSFTKQYANEAMSIYSECLQNN